MQLPHSVHVVRLGPTPPKYGSATCLPCSCGESSSPKSTPTGVLRKVSGTPISSAAARIASSTTPSQGLVTTPSIELAMS